MRFVLVIAFLCTAFVVLAQQVQVPKAAEAPAGFDDGHNGTTKTRPRVPRRFSSLSEAEEENGQSRIYLGIHWSFDKTEGIAQGRRVASYVFRNAFEPVRYGR